MWQVQKEKYKLYLLFQMSRSLKCFNPTCKCAKIELERVLKIRCKNCHCSIIYDIEKLNFAIDNVEGRFSFYQQNT